MRATRVIAGLLVACLFVGGSAAVIPSAPARPAVEIEPAGCVTDECHTDIKKHRLIHGPVHVNACEACHTLVDPANHRFELARDETELCGFCHQIELPLDRFVHQPLKDGQCLQCHNPHGGQASAFLRGASTREMCASCHQDVINDRRHVHGPVAADQCAACHQPHTAQFAKLLVAEGNDLCFTCHAEMKTQLGRAIFPHAPVQQDCMQCHDPHATDFAMQVTAAPKELCIGCHEDIGRLTAQVSHPHSVVVEEQACLTCHTAHGGDTAWLVRTDPLELCMSCHDKAIKIDDSRTVAPVAEVLDPKKVKHGPIRDGNCSGCHNVHGSDVSRLLAKQYPDTFYQPFAMEKYELCFSCHDQQLVERPQAQGLTGFRNGDVNLHYLHVNKSDKGRNCRACHSTHASDNELHLAETVPFGQWAMPINFQRTETGGSCAPGCHRPYEYDRDQPANYDSR